jgi:hypothetical protein
MTTPRNILLAAAVLSVGVCHTACLGSDTPAAEYLSDSLFDRIVSVTQGWGELGVNTAVRPLHAPAMKLRIKDKRYEHGLGHHAGGEIVVDLGGQFKTFHTDVGIQWQGGQNLASAIFQIYVDDKKVFDSGVVHESDPPRELTVSVEGAEELRLVAGDAGDGITCDCTNWANARLVRNPLASQRAGAAGVDIAPFGRVVTWDPKATGGTKAGRVDEFPAADLFPGRELLPAAGGTYAVPKWGGVGSIGLQWDENRLLRQLVLRFADAAAVPPPEAVRLECWGGESTWQGAWQPVNISPERDGANLVWSLGRRGLAGGIQKVRWVFPDASRSVFLKGISAFTRSRWETLDVRIESARPGPETAHIASYNGILLAPEASDLYRATWDRTRPLLLKVRYSVANRYKADRTVLRFVFPDTAFGVAVEDLRASDGVYVPHAGVFITRQPAVVTLDDYLKKISSRATVLARVRRKPDQDFARAMAVVHNPVQDLGPVMLSLACDNRKFVVHRNGAVVFDEHTRADQAPREIPDQWQLVPQFGSGKELPVARHLAGGWLPVPVTAAAEGPVTYQQATCVAPIGKAPAGAPAWWRERAVGVAEYLITNRGSGQTGVSLALDFAATGKRPLRMERVKEGVLAVSGDRLLAFLDTRPAAPLVVEVRPAGVALLGKLSAGGRAECRVYIPAWKVGPNGYAALAERTPGQPCVEAYWKSLLGPAIAIELPDPLLTNIIRASQVHCLLAARNEDHGARVSPWISSDRYGPLESEANSIIRGMDMTGHADFARRSLMFFIKRYNQAGFLTTGYTIVGTGEHLWTLGEHCQRTQDRAWMRSIAPAVARVCQWIVCQRAKTKRRDARGRKVPEYGLMPPGVTADWNRYAYRFFNDAQYCAGLESAARALAEVGHPAARALSADAGQYRDDLLRAYRWTQARSPVVPLDDGTWVPADAALLDCFGRVEDFHPGEDWNRSWACSVEIGSHHLAANRVLEPRSPEVSWMADYLEDVQFLRSGMGEYPEEKNRQDVFSFGGFAKVQPYYGRIAEVYALRDDVKPFVRSYFNAIGSLLSLENLSFWEHFHNTGGWNKTHETGWFLCQSRMMLVLERGDELWLAPMATNRWLQDGMRLSVRQAPTRFGKVSYAITSAAAAGYIEAVIEPAAHFSARRIVIRLRHPNGKPIRAVTVGGKPHDDFNPREETVTIASPAGPISVRAEY